MSDDVSNEEMSHVLCRRVCVCAPSKHKTFKIFVAESCTAPVYRPAPAVIERIPDPLADNNTKLIPYPTRLT